MTTIIIGLLILGALGYYILKKQKQTQTELNVEDGEDISESVYAPEPNEIYLNDLPDSKSNVKDRIIVPVKQVAETPEVEAKVVETPEVPEVEVTEVPEVEVTEVEVTEVEVPEVKKEKRKWYNNGKIQKLVPISEIKSLPKTFKKGKLKKGDK